MTKDGAIIIERTANGYQVRPFDGNNMVCIKDIMVFQEMGFAVASGACRHKSEDLLGFIEAHFTHKVSE